MCAYKVTLAIGNVAKHDTGRRIHVDVLAPSKLDAAVTAEDFAALGLSDGEYPHAVHVRTVGGPTPPIACAIAAAA
jgi:hypothetical protein